LSVISSSRQRSQRSKSRKSKNKNKTQGAKIFSFENLSFREMTPKNAKNAKNLDEPDTFSDIHSLLSELKDQMTLEIKETSDMIITYNNSYRNYFTPTKENLIIFRGFISMTSLIKNESFVDIILESLPWSKSQMELQSKNSKLNLCVEYYLNDPYKINSS